VHISLLAPLWAQGCASLINNVQTFNTRDDQQRADIQHPEVPKRENNTRRYQSGRTTPRMMNGNRTINTRDDEREQNYQHPEVHNGKSLTHPEVHNGKSLTHPGITNGEVNTPENNQR